MKAKEYFEKYEERIMKDFWAGGHREQYAAIREMARELSEEINVLMKKRGVKSVSGAMSILKELNDKWNAISRLFEKNYNLTPIRENGFKECILDVRPELKEFFK